jgi:hypothetical protein
MMSKRVCMRCRSFSHLVTEGQWACVFYRKGADGKDAGAEGHQNLRPASDPPRWCAMKLEHLMECQK